MRSFLSIRLPWLLALGLLFAQAATAAGEDDAWNSVLKKKYFGDRTIEETTDLIELNAPYRAEDPALVPVSITAKIPQTRRKKPAHPSCCTRICR